MKITRIPGVDSNTARDILSSKSISRNPMVAEAVCSMPTSPVTTEVMHTGVHILLGLHRKGSLMCHFPSPCR